MKRIIPIVLLILGALVLLLLIRSCASGKSRRNMLSPKAATEARNTWRKTGLLLSITEPSGVERKAENVTSGVPLPEGSVKDAGALCLQTPDGKPVPCQFTVLSRWPSDGSVKWCLLDFQATVGQSNTVQYLLKEGKAAGVEKPVKVEKKGAGVFVDTGRVQLLIETNKPGLIHGIKCDGKDIVVASNPVQPVLADHSNRLFRASVPTKVEVESSGPVRATVLVQGQFVTDRGEKIFDGKVGYELRITACAGKPYVKLAFTVMQGGWYGFRNEHRKRQFALLKSLSLDMPVAGTEADWELHIGGTNVVCASGTEVAQWFKYPATSKRFYHEDRFESEKAVYKKLWPSALVEPGRAFYWTESCGTNLTPHAGAMAGWFEAGKAGVPSIKFAVRRFSENFPAGMRWTDSRLSWEVLPAGGFWPRTQDAYSNRVYTLEGGRHQTWEALVGFGDMNGTGLLSEINMPLFAVADADWYGNTGAVLPMGTGMPKAKDPELIEAWDRYNRLQKAKINNAYGDPAGPYGGADEDKIWIFEAGKVNKALAWLEKHVGHIAYDGKGLDFIGTKAHGDLTDNFVTVDIAEAFLNDPYDWDGPHEPIVASTEADMDAALTMQLFKLISGQPVIFSDVRHYDEKDKVWYFSNSGTHPTFFAGRSYDPAVNLRQVSFFPEASYYPAGGASVHHFAAAGDVTMARLARKDGRYWMAIVPCRFVRFPQKTMVAKGKTITPEWPCAFARLECSADYFLGNFPCNHIHGCYGDWTAELLHVAGLLGIETRMFRERG